jgi:hypothetical protein
MHLHMCFLSLICRVIFDVYASDQMGRLLEIFCFLTHFFSSYQMHALFRWLANTYMRQGRNSGAEQETELLYAWDIHCNAFFPLFVLLYIVRVFRSKKMTKCTPPHKHVK